ncbi:MAG: hypothetical protein GY795_48790 [Desulfobacterales bacterium]|nr:hypothetical protein [Desulfobacterales bacterium]
MQKLPRQISSISTRNKLRIILYGIIIIITVYGTIIEPEWLIIRHIRLHPNPEYCLVHISDIHYKGDKSYFTGIVDKINKISPDFVCFTGDLVEEKNHLKEVLEILGQIRCPMFGIPGNHEYWSSVPFNEISRVFANTGGFWLVNQRIRFRNNLEIAGMAGEKYHPLPGKVIARKRLLIAHYPALADTVPPGQFDLILAGHSHGGQVRFPIIGAVKVPYGVGKYEKGLYKTRAGALYVNPGVGTSGICIRIFCRPEITVIEF